MLGPAGASSQLAVIALHEQVSSGAPLKNIDFAEPAWCHEALRGYRQHSACVMQSREHDHGTEQHPSFNLCRILISFFLLSSLTSTRKFRARILCLGTIKLNATWLTFV